MNNFLDKYATVGVILSGLALCMSACTAQRIAITPIGEPEVPSAGMPGVDSNLVAQAYALAEVSFARDAEAAVRLAEEGRKLVQLADSLVGGPAPEHRWPPDAADSAHRDIAAGTQAFNAGAEALAKYVEADSIRAVELLLEAAARFEEAIEADPFDEEARYWLARAYELIAARTNTQGPPQAAIEVLQRLVALHRDRHDYIALLAAAYGRVRTDEAFLAAGALWERAAQVAQDDALLDPDQTIVADTGVVFAYYVRGSRAFVEANRSDLALNALHSARSWTRTPEDHALVSSESAYIEWDRGNLANRKQFDALLEIASASPDKAAAGLEELAESVTHAKARMDVQHQLALAWYATGEYESAIGLMQELWHKSGNADSMTAGRLREDYATMAYNICADPASRWRLGGRSSLSSPM